jgi:hypothetical protein
MNIPNPQTTLPTTPFVAYNGVLHTGDLWDFGPRFVHLGMALLSYRRHRFPPPIIQHAIWLYLRFTLSYRDVEELLAERGLEVSY